MKQHILITGSQGYIGSQLLAHCVAERENFGKIVALDIKLPQKGSELADVVYLKEDIRSDKIAEIIEEHKISTIVHLAAIISITGQNSEHFEYDVDVNGSYNLIQAAVQNKVKRFIYSSSGAAYGYWPSNVDTLLTEDMKILGNKDIPYSYHKYLVEERLKVVAEKHPEMEQVILRVGTILGENTNNPITDYLKKPKLLCIKDYPSAFVAIWDQDLIKILFKATQNAKPGIYNVAGTGSIPTEDLAKLLNKPAQVLPIWLLKLAFKVLRPLGLIPYGPESLKFIQYRPVLNNKKLLSEFGYTPEKTTKEVFTYWRDANL